MPSSLGNERLLQDFVASLTELSLDEPSPSRSVLMRDGCHGFTNDVVDRILGLFQNDFNVKQ